MPITAAPTVNQFGIRRSRRSSAHAMAALDNAAIWIKVKVMLRTCSNGVVRTPLVLDVRSPTDIRALHAVANSDNHRNGRHGHDCGQQRVLDEILAGIVERELSQRVQKSHIQNLLFSDEVGEADSPP